MRLLDLTLPSPAENLALDEALLLDAEAGCGEEVLRLWEWPRPAVILGAGVCLAAEVDESACHLDGVPILRRSSGGGTVLLDAGCLVYTLILRHDGQPCLSEIRPSHEFILRRIGEALSDVVPWQLAGTSDLAAEGKKFSGNSQQRKRRRLLHHGTLLYQFDLAKVGRYLHFPARAPDYRAGRSHADFLMNLPARAEDLKRRLAAAWNAVKEPAEWPRELVDELARSKYSSQDWIRRR